jgi:hypothetical protein
MISAGRISEKFAGYSKMFQGRKKKRKKHPSNEKNLIKRHMFVGIAIPADNGVGG